MEIEGESNKWNYGITVADKNRDSLGVHDGKGNRSPSKPCSQDVGWWLDKKSPLSIITS